MPALNFQKRFKVKNGNVISTTQSLTRDQAIKIFKLNPKVDRINERGGWWDRRTFVNELK
jgi:hypothetical protein